MENEHTLSQVEINISKVKKVCEPSMDSFLHASSHIIGKHAEMIRRCMYLKRGVR
jgi:hypothetical protein